MERFLTAFSAFALALVLIILFAFINGFIVMIFWNWLMPALFDLPTITYIQGWGLSVLCASLFKSSVSTNNSK